MFSEMLAEATRTTERMVLTVTSTIELLPWITRENMKLFIKSILNSPRFVKYSLIMSGILLAPFFLIVGHNAYNLRVSKEAISPVFLGIGHMWFVYTLILPLLALIVTSIASMCYIKPRVAHAESAILASHVLTNLPFLMLLSAGAVELLVLF